MASNLTRHAALRMFGAAAGIALLAACQAPAPATPPTVASAPKPTSPATAAQPTAAVAPTSSPALTTDRAAQARFIPVGVGPSNTAPLSAPKGQPRSGGSCGLATWV